MSTMLGREMDELERAQLINMTFHPGYQILIHMMNQACELATAAVIKLDPIVTEDFDRKLSSLQNIARATNDFCASLIKSIEAHKFGEGVKRGEQKAIDLALQRIEEIREKD